ncbi:hypothetical protein BB415_02875 [Helicobacter pylori]|nr:hypothetical protein BB415_02875 [Helicobacter pylori]
MFGSHDKLLLWIYPHNCTYGGVYFTTIFLKTKSQSIKNTLKSLIEHIKTPKNPFFSLKSNKFVVKLNAL